ncbi:restriction endonuclease [Natronomonas halophila]|uniref:restriction endonuclease n=1 Tax=Natronomonas halophila TaxID=2747817 RepID=UPI0015B52420|nr:restriction endonuclease [Natronomonas halophila]QLD85470.1 restriction endonuclease [Natronomonas halophila]
MSSESAAEQPDPISVAEALQRLDTRTLRDLVRRLWEERGWTLEDESSPDDGGVDLVFAREWPQHRRVLLRVRSFDANDHLNTADVQAFVRTVQREEVDIARIVTTTETPSSVEAKAREYGVDVMGPAALGTLLDRLGERAALAAHVDAPVITDTGTSLPAWVPDRLAAAADRLNLADRLERLLARYLPPDPTMADMAALSFTGHRIALVASALALLFLVPVGTQAVLFWVLMTAYLLVTYGALLPAMTADIYLRRQIRGEWVPSWWYLGAFIAVPLPLLAGALYWYRRRNHRPARNDVV